MKRILVVGQHLPHYRKDVFLALEAAQGYEVHFAAGFSARDAGIATMNPSDLENFHPLQNIWLGPMLWQRGLLRLLRRRWHRVVLLGDAAHLTTWLAAARQRAVGKPAAFWTIGWHRPDVGFRKTIRLAFYKLADRLLLYGEDGRQVGILAGYPQERMSVIGNSSSASPGSLVEGSDRMAEIRSVLAQISAPAVGAVVRLTPSKQLEELLQAVAYLEQSGGPRLSAILAGDGPAADSLKSAAHTLQVDLHLVGPVYGECALQSFYDKCLATLLPNRAGLTTIQSLRFGRPVITHNDPNEQMPEYAAIIPGKTGDLVPKGDIVEMARALEKWVKEVQSRPLEVAAACRAAVADGWTAESSARRIIDALEI